MFFLTKRRYQFTKNCVYNDKTKDLIIKLILLVCEMSRPWPNKLRERTSAAMFVIV